MTKLLASLYAFNRGVADPLFFGRPDIKRLALSAETQTNWMPRVLGPMMLRPGFGYTGGTYANAKAVHFSFIYATNDTAIIELTDSIIRVKISETAITRVAVSSAVTNGNFGSDITSWTDDDEAGGTSAWLTGGYMSLIGNGTNSARRTQQVTVSGGDINKEHALRIIVQRGPVILKVGTTSGDDSYISTTTLGTGAHSLAFTPTGDFYIQVLNNKIYAALIDSINVEGSGVMTLPSPYPLAQLGNISFDQSADVIYLGCYGYQQRKIERRGTRSWSIVLYEPIDGPFRVINVTPTRLSSSALTGDVTLTASKPLFKSTHVGTLFKISSTGQQVTISASSDDQFTNEIRVNGISDARQFDIDITGTWMGTVTLQRSISEPGSWADVSGQTWTSNASTNYSDGLDNQIIYYRIGIKTAEYTSGTAVITLTYASGSIDGIVKVTAFSSATSVSAKVVKALGGTASTPDWYEGEWSDRRGWPSAGVLYGGRIFWAGKLKVWGSVSDAYESFDDSVEGDSGTINRTIGSGPVDDINWLLPLQRLILGTDGSEKSARSTSFDEPLTPTNFNLKNASTQGSKKVPPVVVDNLGYFVHRSGNAVFEMKLDQTSFVSLDYATSQTSLYAPTVVDSAIVRMAVQRQPDTRIHCVRTDGKVAVLISDPLEDVKCWILIETDGVIEDAFVMPGSSLEDTVYYSIKRTINGSTVRYLEKYSLESECVGGTLNKQADAFITFTQASSTTVTGLSHLEGAAVIVWANGKDYSPGVGASQTTFTVTGGSITLPTAVTSGIVGLPYKARFKSVKLAYMQTANGPLMVHTALTQRKRVNQLAFLMRHTHYQGLQYGRDFDNLDELPLVEDGVTTPADTIWEDFDKDALTFAGNWTTDSRVCLQATAPRPCTMAGTIIGIDVNEKV